MPIGSQLHVCTMPCCVWGSMSGIECDLDAFHVAVGPLMCRRRSGFSLELASARCPTMRAIGGLSMPTRVLTSPLQRTLQTTAIIFPGRPASPNLRQSLFP